MKGFSLTNVYSYYVLSSVSGFLGIILLNIVFHLNRKSANFLCNLGMNILKIISTFYSIKMYLDSFLAIENFNCLLKT